jgi:hypothetical protein
MSDLQHAARAERAKDFIASAIRVHGRKYDYVGVVAEFQNQKTPVAISCRTHDVTFRQTPQDHLRGSGCPDCRTRRGSTSASRAAMFEQKAAAKHGGKYRYDLDTYTDVRSVVQIFCTEPGHGWFPQRATNHLQGKGCPDCAERDRRKTWSAGYWAHRPRPETE